VQVDSGFVRKTSITASVVLGMIAIAVSACSTAPAPAPSKPAPNLPANSIAYDTVPVRTGRNMPFAENCSQIAGNSALQNALGVDPGNPQNAQALQSGSQPNQYKSCVLTTSAGQLYIEAVSPQAGHGDPWQSAWSGQSLYQYTHFRRLVLLGHYYAVYQNYYSAAGNGGTLSVQTGSPDVLALTLYEPQFANSDVIANPQLGVTIGQQTLPAVQHLAEALLTAIDPGGGSLAAS
jgi:hypothetical protein